MSAEIEFIPTPHAIRWAGRYLDREQGRDALFHAIEAAVIRTFERLNDKGWPPPPKLFQAIRSSQRLSGISTLLTDIYVPRSN